MPWPIEPIPDGDELYMRVPRRIIADPAQIPAGVFRDRDGMSTDWCKYARPEDTRRGGPQPPDQYAVIALVVRDVVALPPLQVKHTPIEPSSEVPSGNRAHADIVGLNAASPPRRKTEIRERLWDAAQLRIRVDDPVAE